MRGFVPHAGDLVWFDFAPSISREQAGRRPALVLSPRSYNGKTSLAVVCPITSHAKGYPFEIPLPATSKITGVILADHWKSLDWQQRRAEKAGSVSASVLQHVLDRIAALLNIS